MTLITIQKVASVAVTECKRTNRTLRGHFAELVDCGFLTKDQAREAATILARAGYDMDSAGSVLPAIDADALTLDDAGVVDCKS